ncbi:alpha/beta fold hydrolase [Salinicoccus sp. RF5]|uniref:alpha/beta hydrolase n=1 Tax=Salinicoccus sp. RF5 TaxID=2748874 RepID=UPI001E4D6083|nr:alpha/beta fold hydrolase [Salinicoccus sp. RF5]
MLFLHGYTGGRYELEPLFDYLKSRYDFEYEFPVYPGHGTILDLKASTGDQWYAEALDAYHALKQRVDRVHIIGFSMGGVFASHIAQHEPVEKLVLIAPAFEHIKLSQLNRLSLTPRHFSEHMKMKLYQKIKKRIKDIPFRAYQEFKTIVETKKDGVEHIHSRTLIIHGKLDLLVPYESSVELAKKIPDATLELIEDAPHLFAFTDRNQLELNIAAERFLFKE